LNTVMSAVKNKEPYSLDYRIVRPDGEERIVHSRGHIMSGEDGNPIRVFGATQDVTELKRAEEKLKATSEQLRALSARLQSAREEEGTRIAREIHDELGSALTSLKWDLEEIDKQLSTPLEPLALVALREKFQTPMKLADLAITAIRRIASELRPSVLDDLGLVAAIEWQCQQFQSRTGIVCVCDCSLEKVELTEEQSTAVFRILQEALTNVLRHSHATKVDIKINKENGYFVLSVSDNGKGITESVKSEQQTLGILGMRERAHLIGGEIGIKGVAGKGTVVIVRVPISGQDRVLKMTR
jgi:signal transduction histidine kinase